MGPNITHWTKYLYKRLKVFYSPSYCEGIFLGDFVNPVQGSSLAEIKPNSSPFRSRRFYFGCFIMYLRIRKYRYMIVVVTGEISVRW